MHLIWQENRHDAPQRLPLPRIINLLTDLKEEHDVLMMKIVNGFEKSLNRFPPIKMGTPDPYHPLAERLKLHLQHGAALSRRNLPRAHAAKPKRTREFGCKWQRKSLNPLICSCIFRN
jgi:hypothetical protein